MLDSIKDRHFECVRVTSAPQCTIYEICPVHTLAVSNKPAPNRYYDLHNPVINPPRWKNATVRSKDQSIPLTLIRKGSTRAVTACWLEPLSRQARVLVRL